MKKLIAMLLALVCLAGVLTASAEGLSSIGGLMDAFSGLLGGESEETEAADEAEEAETAPETFDGELVDVVIDEEDGTTIQVHEDFLEVMDEYEAFFDEYVEVMSQDEPDTMALLDFLGQYAEMMEALTALEDAELDEGDLAYYTIVLARISAKLATVE